MTTKITSQLGLDEELVNALSAIFTSIPAIHEVVIFGSRAKGNYHEGSDIDLAIKGENITIDTILDLKVSIDELELLYQVDVQEYDSITNQDLMDHINRVGKVLWKR